MYRSLFQYDKIAQVLVIPVGFVLFIMDANVLYVKRSSVVLCHMLNISDFKINFTYRTDHHQFRKQISLYFSSITFAFHSDRNSIDLSTILFYSKM